MPTFAIAVDLGDKLPNHALTAEAFPNLAYAVETITALTHERWTQYAMGLPLPDGQVVHPRDGTYARSILSRAFGPFRGEVYTELAYAKDIEQGTAARDMKKILGTSLKVRLTKDGRRYLIIPIRHDTPGTAGGTNGMPAEVHAWWQGKQASSVSSALLNYRRLTTHYQDASGKRHGVYDMKTKARITVPAWRYHWGDRMSKKDLTALGMADHQVKRMAGMVNFRTPGKSGGAANSQYMTFRTMVEGGKGWIAPAQPGRHVAQQTADQVRPMAEQAFAAAVEADVRAALA